MWKARFLLGALAAALTPGALGCSDSAECSPEAAHCEGNVAWYCNGGGDKGPLVWESQECPTDTTCIKGVCFSEPLVTCSKEEVTKAGCSADGLRVGLCRAAGYWSWTGHCDPKLGATCMERHITEDNQDEVWASCVVKPLESCTQVDSRTCKGNVKLECVSLGYWAWPQDCTAEGLVCQAGECVAAP